MIVCKLSVVEESKRLARLAVTHQKFFVEDVVARDDAVTHSTSSESVLFRYWLVLINYLLRTFAYWVLIRCDIAPCCEGCVFFFQVANVVVKELKLTYEYNEIEMKRTAQYGSKG